MLNTPASTLWFEPAQHSLLGSFIRYNSKYRYYLLGQKWAFVLLIRKGTWTMNGAGRWTPSSWGEMYNGTLGPIIDYWSNPH